MMNRTFIKTPAGENLTRYTIRIESEECPKGTQIARFLQFELLRTLSDPQNAQCGLSDFQTLSMKHDGCRWVVTLEAVAP